MDYRDLLKELVGKYGLVAKDTYDSDVDVLLPEGRVPIGLSRELDKYGFKKTGRAEYDANYDMKYIHIHAPHRKEVSWFDRGWDWPVMKEGNWEDISELCYKLPDEDIDKVIKLTNLGVPIEEMKKMLLEGKK